MAVTVPARPGRDRWMAPGSRGTTSPQRTRQLGEHPQPAPAGRRTSPCRPAPRRRRRAAARPRPSPVATPPTPTIGRSGRAAWTSCTARTATGWIAGPDSPPPPAPSAGRRVVGSSARPSSVLMQRDRLGTGRRRTARGDVDDAVGVGAELRPARPPAAGRGGDHRRRQLGVVGEDRAAALEVRARQVDLDGDDLGGRRGEQVGGRGGSRRPMRPQMLATTRRARCAAGGQTWSSQCGDARALQADGVEHPLRRRVQPRRRVAGPLVGGERLDDDRAERRRGRSSAASSVAVAGRARGRHHRVGAARPSRRCTRGRSASAPRRRRRRDRSSADASRQTPSRSPRGTPAASGPRASSPALLGEALDGGERGVDRRHAADPVQAGRLADLLAVGAAAAALRRVDDER